MKPLRANQGRRDVESIVAVLSPELLFCWMMLLLLLCFIATLFFFLILLRAE